MLLIENLFKIIPLHSFIKFVFSIALFKTSLFVQVPKVLTFHLKVSLKGVNISKLLSFSSKLSSVSVNQILIQ